MILPSGLTWRDLPRLQPHDDLVAEVGLLGQHGLAEVDVDVVDEARVVGDDVVELLRLLQRADDGFIRALEDADHAALAALTRFRATVAAVARVHESVAIHPREHLVAVERDPGVLGGDETGPAGRASR